MKSFSQVIFKVGINPCVIPPEEVVQHILKHAKKRSGPIPVRGTINGAQYIQTLMKFQGHWRLYINGPMLKAAKLKVNDVASITIEHDPSDRTVLPHPEFSKVLGRDPRAIAAFNALPPSRQKEINRYLNNLKTDSIRIKNIGKVMDHLTGKRSKHTLAVLRPTKKK
jgi:hypothetical protein